MAFQGTSNNTIAYVKIVECVHLDKCASMYNSIQM